jgi:hypothetical protein
MTVESGVGLYNSGRLRGDRVWRPDAALKSVSLMEPFHERNAEVDVSVLAPLCFTANDDGIMLVRRCSIDNLSHDLAESDAQV